MSSINNNNNKKQQNVNSECCENGFHMGIKDDFIDPLENNFGINDLEKKCLMTSIYYQMDKSQEIKNNNNLKKKIK